MAYGSPGIPMIAPPNVNIPAVPFQMPSQLFRYGEQALWSTQRFNASAGAVSVASSSYRLFSTAIGNSGQGFNPMSIAETPLKEGGRIPAGVAFDVFGIACHIYFGTSSAFNTPADSTTLISNLVNVQNNAVLAWNFLQTSVEISPIVMIGAGGGAFGSVSQNAAGSNTGAMNNGAGAVWLYRKHAVALPGQQTFALVLSFGNYAAAVTSGVDMAVRISLLGYYKNLIEIG